MPDADSFHELLDWTVYRVIPIWAFLVASAFAITGLSHYGLITAVEVTALASGVLGVAIGVLLWEQLHRAGVISGA